MVEAALPLIFLWGCIQALLGVSRLVRDPRIAVARRRNAAIKDPGGVMIQMALRSAIATLPALVATQFARLPWFWGVMAGVVLLPSLFVLFMGLLSRLPALADRLGRKTEGLAPVRPEEVDGIPRLARKAQARRQGGWISLALGLLWVWAWWPVMIGLLQDR